MGGPPAPNPGGPIPAGAQRKSERIVQPAFAWIATDQDRREDQEDRQSRVEEAWDRNRSASGVRCRACPWEVRREDPSRVRGIREDRPWEDRRSALCRGEVRRSASPRSSQKDGWRTWRRSSALRHEGQVRSHRQGHSARSQLQNTRLSASMLVRLANLVNQLLCPFAAKVCGINSSAMALWRRNSITGRTGIVVADVREVISAGVVCSPYCGKTRGISASRQM